MLITFVTVSWSDTGVPIAYRKNSKNWDTLNHYRNCLTNGTAGFYSAVMRSKYVDRITNRVDPDQTAPCGAVLSGSALFAQTYLSQYFKYNTVFWFSAAYMIAILAGVLYNI